MSVPKLRFKEFDEDWTQVKLKDLVRSLDSGISVNGEDIDVTEDDFSVLKTSCVSLGTFNSNERKKVTLEHEIQRLKEPLLDNSLVMNRSNTPLLVGSSAFIKKAPKKTYLSDKLWQFKVNQNANIQWIAFYFSNETTLIKLRDMATGTSNSMKNITKPDVLNIDLFAPQKEEQTKIASFLSNVDEKISQLTQKHSLLSQYKQGMMQKLFSQQLRFKADDGSEFGDWEEKTLGGIADIKRGASPRPIKDKKWFSETSNVGWVRISDVTRSNHILLKTQQYLSNLGIEKSRFVPKGSLIMSICATIGKPIYTGFNVCIHDGFVVFENLKLNHSYAYHYLFFIKDNWYHYGQPGTQVNLNSDIVNNETICVPCLEEQTKIANFLSAIDQKIEVVAQQIEQAKVWKKGLLQQMFV